jgi:hypothetical protein
MSPGRALVPYVCAGTPAVDDACTAGRVVTTRPAFVGGASGENAVQNGEKHRDQTNSHRLGLLSLQPSLNPLAAVAHFPDRFFHSSF